MMPIRLRASMACSTSGGSEMFSMMNFGIAMPCDAISSSDSILASRSPSSLWRAARSSMGMPELPSSVPSFPTISCRRYSSTSSVRNCGSVPASSFSSLAGSVTRAA